MSFWIEIMGFWIEFQNDPHHKWWGTSYERTGVSDVNVRYVM